MTDLELRVVRYDDPVAQELVAEVQAEYVLRYGGPDRTPVDVEEFTPPRGLFLVGLVGDVPVAAGAFRAHGDGVAEIKRMYVRRAHRGRGLGRALLDELERRARAAGHRRVVLETGTRQPEAIALYAASGYEPIEKFGIYRCEPSSRCYGKDL